VVEDDPDQELTQPELRKRASSGIFFTATSQLLLLLVGFFGNLVLARLLTPRDFGIVAIGMTVMVLVAAIGEGGLVSGLLRRERAPTPAELRTLAGLQLLIMTSAFVVAAPIASQLGRTGEVAAVMLLALPLSAPQGAGRVILLRQMRFSRLALAELGASAAYYLWAIPAVVAGLGVWGMATGSVVKAIASSVLLISIAPGGRVMPSLRGARAFREVMVFGAKFQATWLAFVGREQVLNALTAAIAGLTPLGYWSLARRLMELPNALVDSVHRVVFPAMVHLIRAGVDPQPRIERSARSTGIATSILLTGFAAGAPGLVPAAFGEQWEPAVWAILPASLALAILSPVAVGAVGFVQAVNRPGVMFRAVVIGGIAWIATTAALLPSLGVAALGIGWVASACCEVSVYSVALRRGWNVHILRPALVPMLACLPSALVGCAIAFEGGSNALSGIAGAACGVGLALASLWLVRRDDLIASTRLLSGAVGDAVRPLLARRSAGPA
jgi:O-antigen/teichoic acid export membrane protein